MRHYLIVDDNVAFAENLAEILRDEGNMVSLAASGVEALKLVQTTRFDAVLTDMRMPSMGGAQLVHELRQIDPGMPAMVVTAYIGDDDINYALREGLLAVLGKPIPILRLMQLLGAARRDGIVVLVEDDRALSDNLSEALRSRGLAAVTASSVLETQRLGPLRPFAAIVDLRVPGGPDGEAMRQVSARFPRLPIVVITGHDDIVPPAAAHDLLHKPFATEALMQKIEQLYETRSHTS
jgi:two-component system, response regulator PdtaR